MNASDARKAHDLLDDLYVLAEISQEQEKLLRSFLPERPKDATLDDLLTRVHAAWLSANPSDWGFDTPAEHHDWLFDLRNDLVRIIEEQDAPVKALALPAGMRIADHEEYGRVVVSPKTTYDGYYQLFFFEDGLEQGSGYGYASERELKFIDTEPAPAHPEFLETEADYESAPEGTIVAKDDISTAWIKRCGAWKSTDGDRGVRCPNWKVGHRIILRWGLGE